MDWVIPCGYAVYHNMQSLIGENFEKFDKIMIKVASLLKKVFCAQLDENMKLGRYIVCIYHKGYNNL